MMMPRGGNGDGDKNQQLVETYASGNRAAVFKADGSGFIFYPSGQVAICKAVVDGRGRYYLYEDDSRSTPLGAVDEHAVGFFLGPADVRLALSKVGGLITNKDGYIVREWRYDPGSHMPPPIGILEVKLNRSMSFEFLDRSKMRIKFFRDGISHELDAGMRSKREGTYLDHSIRLPGGRLEPQLDRISLVARQHAFGNMAKAKRDRLKPCSRNLAGACKGLVAGLEHRFDGMGPQVEPFPNPSWKNDARVATCQELPRIRSTGQEVGPTHGLGSKIYGDDQDGDRNNGGGGGPGMRQSRSEGGGRGGGVGGAEGALAGRGPNGGDEDAFAPSARLRKGGKWLGELDVRLQLNANNPLLRRSSLLQAASGRYAEEIVVPGGKTSVSNPTGKTTVAGVPLRRVPASRLRAFLEDEAGPDQLVVVLGIRGDDPICGKVQHTAELANRFLLERYSALPGSGDGDGDGGGNAGALRSVGGSNNAVTHVSSRASASSSPNARKYRMVKVDFAEQQSTAELYGVKALPAFLMFQGGRLAWAGMLGGCPVKAAPPDTVEAGQRVLLVEPCAKAQLAAERALRRFGCTWDLVLNASQALLRVQAHRTNAMAFNHGGASSSGGGSGYGVLMISDALGATEVMALEKAFHAGGAGHGGSGGSVIVGLAQVQGDPSAASAATLEVFSAGFAETLDLKRAVLSPHLALVADMAVTKPPRASALEVVFRCCKRRRKEAAASAGVTAGGGTNTLSMSASCSTLEGGDRRYMGVTPSRLLEKMEEIGAQVAMGNIASKRAAGAGRQHRPGGATSIAGGANGGILVPAQETSYRGFVLDRSTFRHIAGS